MNRSSIEQTVGYAWALGASACMLLVGVLAIVVPVGMIFGETAGRWTLGTVAALSVGMIWLLGEAVHAWRVERGEGEALPLHAVSSRRPL